MDMNAQVLRSVKGGYNKLAVITKLDSYNTLLAALEQGSLNRRQALDELEKIRYTELPKEKSGLFGKVGFSAEDTDAYLQNCEQMILEKLENLI